MTASRRVHIELDLEPGRDTIGGQLAVDGGPAGDFYGWLELIDRLQRATDGPTAAADGPHGGGRRSRSRTELTPDHTHVQTDT